MSSNISSHAVVSVGNTRGLLKGNSVLFCPTNCRGPMHIRKTFISSGRIRAIISFLGRGDKNTTCDRRVRGRIGDGRGMSTKKTSSRSSGSICFMSTKGFVVRGSGTSVKVLRQIFGVKFGHTTQVVSRLTRTKIMKRRRNAGPEGMLVSVRRFRRCVRRSIWRARGGGKEVWL